MDREQAKPPAPFYDAFAQFFNNPTMADFREVLKGNLGELNAFDFKGEWPDYSSVVKHILGIANYGGGCIVVGVRENEDGSFEPQGIDDLRDPAQISQKLVKFLPQSLFDDVTVLPFVFKDSEYEILKGKAFQVIHIAPDPKHSPFVSKAESTDIKLAAIYTRRGTSIVEANHDELQRILNRRIETKYSTSRELSLTEHLEQLKILYETIPASYTRSSSRFNHFIKSLGDLFVSADIVESEPNPDYPSQTYSGFLAECIRRKKARVESELDI